MSSLHIVSYAHDRLQDLDFLINVKNLCDNKEKDTRSKRGIQLVNGSKYNNNLRHWERRRTTSHMRYIHIGKKKRKIDSGSNINNDSSSNNNNIVCKRYRRRASNLSLILHSGNDGNDNVKWLQSHLWLRKRMKMENIWGYCLPMHHSGRSMKSAINFTDNGSCVLFDNSFMCPIQISCINVDEIVQFIMNYIDPSISLLNQEQNCFSNTELNALVYEFNTFPNNCLGPVILSCINDSDDGYTLWLWCHPSFYGNMKAMFQLNDSVGKLNIAYNCELVRFIVTGNGSVPVIAQALQVESDIDGGNDHQRIGNFFHEIMQSEGLCQVWSTGLMLPLDIIDRRYDSKCQAVALPLGSIKSKRRYTKLKWPDKLRNQSSGTNYSIWNKVHVSNCNSTFIPDDVINMQKFNAANINSMPITQGKVAVDPPDSNKVKRHTFPVVLIRSDLSSVCNRKYCSTSLSSWSIVGPSKWGKHLWSSLVFAGAKVVGLDEWDAIQVHRGISSFPRDYPETAAGQAYWDRKMQQNKDVQLKRPANRRNYCINNCNSVDEDISDDTGVSYFGKYNIVIRGTQYIKAFHPFECVDANRSVHLVELPELPSPTLIAVLLSPLGHRGTIRDNAAIFTPTDPDYFSCQLYYNNRDTISSDVSKNKRLGMWRGMLTDKIDNISCNSINFFSMHDISKKSSYHGFKPLGYVTSGTKSSNKHSYAIGLCDVGKLHETLTHSYHTLSSDSISDGNCSSINNPLYYLVLYSNPRSKWFRPAFIKYQYLSLS